MTAIGAGDAFRPTAGIGDTTASGVLGDMLAGAAALRSAPNAMRLVAAEVPWP